MNFRNLYFLSKANIKGNKSSNLVTALICLLVVAITLISSYSFITTTALNRYKEDYKARALSLSPSVKSVTDEAIKSISSLEHVEVVADACGMLEYTCPFNITNTSSEIINQYAETSDTRVNVHGLYEKEKKNIIKGNDLEDKPVFSCLVPSIFYPYADAGESDFKDLDYIDGRTLIGQTITVQGYNGFVDLRYYVPRDNGYNEQVNVQLPTPEFTLKVVGCYPCSYSTSGNFRDLYVSRETELLMTQMTLEAAGINVSSDDSDIAKWWSTPSLHKYLVVVDDYSNMSEVFNSVSEMGYAISSYPIKPQDDTTVLLANLFKFVGTFLTVAIAFISVVILVQSSVSAINERKGYIGLMKAIGYKNRQVFLTLLWEQLYMSLRAFVIGGAVSTALAYVINLYFEHGTYRQLQYVMDWNVYFMFLGVAFLIVLFVPIITELLLLKKLVAIEPRDAMNAK